MSTKNRNAVIKENKAALTPAKLIRWSGLAAIVGGIIFAGIQPIHPDDVVTSVTGSLWAVITPLKVVMSLLFLLGITGIYARQVKEAGWLGLAGFLLFGFCWTMELAFIFAEAFILPPLAGVAPKFVDSFLGIAAGRSSEVDLGAIPVLYGVGVGGGYMLGGLVFGIAIFRAGILSRWAASLLAITAILTPLAALLPHAIQRLAAIPMGVALAWLGYSLWAEQRVKTTEAEAEILLNTDNPVFS